MNILISNDDGVYAKGINSLFNSLVDEFNPLIVAPDQERSSCGHGLSLDKSLRLKKISDNIYACNGLPADCILIGLGHLFKKKKPDLILSGINHGANLGQDRFYSGTMAAAREGLFREVPSISVSLVMTGQDTEFHFDSAASFIKGFIKSNLWKDVPPMHLININIPNLKMENISGVEYASAGFQLYSEELLERKDAKGRDYFWVGGKHIGFSPIENSDCDLVSRGIIAITIENLQKAEEFKGEQKDRFIEGLKELMNEKN